MITKVLPDSNVLNSKTVRDWLFLLRDASGGGMFTLHTTEDIVSEVTYHLRRNNRGVDGAVIHRLSQLLRESTDTVIAEYPHLSDFAGADANDGHIHAAAVAGEIDLVLTNDSSYLKIEDDRYEISTPDEFFCLVDDSTPRIVQAVALKQFNYWRAKMNPRSIWHALAQAGCDEFADRVHAHCRALVAPNLID
ncbi:PIN domain-containing protein [Georgenia sp. Z1491]|uniref:PIN domain-containing protein n=1 Tax=Georgenia sp. Z1491 TaxID=3416707 RepID=UPI003CEC15A4